MKYFIYASWNVLFIKIVVKAYSLRNVIDMQPLAQIEVCRLRKHRDISRAERQQALEFL